MTRRFHLAALMVGLTLTALLIMSAPAGAAQLDLVGGSTSGSPSLYPYQQWADDSYAPTYPGAVQLVFSPVSFTCGTVAGAVGCTTWSGWPTPQVEIDTGSGPYWTHQYLMHELGHVFDGTEMQDPFRADFMAIWGLPGGASAGGRRSPRRWQRRRVVRGVVQAVRAVWTADALRRLDGDSPAYGFPGARDSAQQDASCRLILQVGRQRACLPAPNRVRASRARGSEPQVVECRGSDLLLLGNQVLCETVSGALRSAHGA